MKTEIPKQLKKEKFRFVLIDRGEKRPYEKNWQESQNYKHNSKTLKNHLKNGGNYGVATGYGNLVVIDADKQKIADAIKKHLPETFTVQSGGGGYHFYYTCKDMEKPIRLEEEKAGDIGDIQSKGKQVVGPNSLHPNGDKYTVEKDKKIAKTKAETIRFALKDWIKSKTKEKIDQKSKEDFINIPITEIIDTKDLEQSSDEYYGPHPIHGSTQDNNPRNFWINPNKNTWHCFRDNSGGGPLLWLAVKYGIIDCSDAQPGVLRDEKFVDTIKKADENNILDAEDFLDRDEAAQTYQPADEIKEKLENKDIYKHIIETIGKTVKGDRHLREILSLAGMSAYSTEPQNIFNEGRSSTGKTYNATEVTNLFPSEDTWFIGDMTPKSFVYDKYEWDEDRGKRIVDMNNRIIVFLEPPSRKTYEMLRPLLSHDQEEIEYKFTDSEKMKTQSVIIKGWPATIFCSSEVEYIEDLSTRGTTISPEINEEKWKKANKLVGKMNSKPWKQEKIINKRKTVEEILKSIRTVMIRHNLKVVVPYADALAKNYEVDTARDMRDFPRLIGFTKQAAIFNVFNRPIMGIDGEKYIIATERDYEIGASLFLRTFEASQYGVPETVLEFFKGVILENPSGLSYDKLQSKAQQKMAVDLGGKRFKEKYVYPLLNNGLAIREKDPDDGRRHIIKPTDMEKQRNTAKSKISNFREFFSEKRFKKWLKGVQKNSRNEGYRVTTDLSLNIINSPPPKFLLLFDFLNGKYQGDIREYLKRVGAKKKSPYFSIISEDREGDNGGNEEDEKEGNDGVNKMEDLGDYEEDWDCDECETGEAEYSIPIDKENDKMLHLCGECYKEMGYEE